MLQNTTVRFLKDLKKNNNKPWFDSHRHQYDDARSDFEQFIASVILRHSKKDENIRELEAKKCLFRINRDIRFSKDKTPYKTNLGASMARGGKKSIYAGYYFHLEPGNESFVGGGIWMPMPEEMKKIRQEIDYSLDEFKKIVESKKFKAAYGELYVGEDVKLVKVPQGFEKENSAAEYLKLKSWLALRKLKDEELTSKDLLKKVIDSFEALQPLLNFLNRAIEPAE